MILLSEKVNEVRYRMLSVTSDFSLMEGFGLKKKYSLRKRLQFKFDCIMSKGVVSKIGLLLIVTLLFVFVLAT